MAFYRLTQPDGTGGLLRADIARPEGVHGVSRNGARDGPAAGGRASTGRPLGAGRGGARLAPNQAVNA
jgi:hypothetical protein